MNEKLIHHLHCLLFFIRGNWGNDFCLFIIFSTYFQNLTPYLIKPKSLIREIINATKIFRR